MTEGAVAECEPWSDASFRADLQAYAAGGAELSRRFAADAVLLARLAARVPREQWDTRGATAWTSFLGEVAVARRCSTQAAATSVAEAQQLVGLMPCALELLEQGRLPVPRARALLDATRPCPDAVVRLADAELAAAACDLVPARVRAAVDRLALQHDVDAAAERAGRAAAGRGTRRTALPDAQSELAFTGPAMVLAQVQAALDADARAWSEALRGTGDGRGIDQLRFDLGVHRLLGGHAPVVERPVGAPAAVPALDGPADLPQLPDAASACWWTDRRFSRPVRLDVTVPVTTALGLADEPGWLPGYGWVAAPLVRQLLPVAELRQACVAAGTAAAGQLVDLADVPVRPGRSPAEVRRALVGMATQPFDVTDKAWRAEPRHDPSDALAEFVRLRDRYDDSPSGTRPLRAHDADLDHDRPYDDRLPPPPRSRPAPPPGAWAPAATRHGDLGLLVEPERGLVTLVDLGHEDVDPDLVPPAGTTGPTAAWNLAGRGRRAHGLKHRGWTPLRTATSTLWWTPAGQVVEVPSELHPPAPLQGDRRLEEPEGLHAREAALVRSAHEQALGLGAVQQTRAADGHDERAGCTTSRLEERRLRTDDPPPF